MKKLILFLILCVVSIGFVGCDKPKISYSENYVSIYENQEYKVDENKISIAGKTNSYSVISLDTNIAKIRDNFVVPVSAGKTKIRLKTRIISLIFLWKPRKLQENGLNIIFSLDLPYLFVLNFICKDCSPYNIITL